ncbi:MAG: bifunctional YncE family protein/alkaline phosphatase family protein [Bryobacterales bacterium]
MQRVGAIFLLAASLCAQQRVGRLPDGGAILPTGWPLTPAGEQIELGTLPMALELSADGGHAVVLEAGFLPPALSVVDLQSRQAVQSIPLGDAWLGLTANRKKTKFYVGGGASGNVLELDWKDGKLAPGRQFQAVDPAALTPQDFIGDVRLSADERFLYAANLFRDEVVVLNASSGIRVGAFRTGPRPYRMRLGIEPDTLWISHWGASSVGLYRVSEGRMLQAVPAGGLASDIVIAPGEIEPGPDDQDAPPLVARLYVASANTNSVWVYGLTANQTPRLIERLSLGPSLTTPAGTAPSALALRPDGKRLYITCSGNNLIAVADIESGASGLIGAIPTGWYPTAAAALPDGRLLYLNGKGGGSHPEPNGPDPTRRGEPADYVAALEKGSLGIVPPLDESTLAAATVRTAQNIPYDDDLAQVSGAPENHPVPARLGQPSPIEHVIYVLAENRTYDQILGDIGGAEGDAALASLGGALTPNYHKLAREFVALDNFYTPGSVSADGLFWSFAGMANDYVEKLWPSVAAGRLRTDPFAGNEPARIPPAGFLWTNALSAGLSVRNYGIESGDPTLEPYTDKQYPGFDLNVSDGRRVDAFLADFGKKAAAGELPGLMLVHLPNSHTAGRTTGYPTARAMIAEHDYALGRLVEGVSQSATWEKTLIVIAQDDAQDGRPCRFAPQHLPAGRPLGAPRRARLQPLQQPLGAAHHRVRARIAADVAVRRHGADVLALTLRAAEPHPLPGRTA